MENSEIKLLKERKARVETSHLYKGKIINLRLDNAFYGDGTRRNIEVVEHPRAVVIIPVTSQKKIIFIKQYRKVIDNILIELPAGLLEKNETPFACAQRELQEEVGFKANKMISLSGFYTSPGFCTEYIHIFIAKDLEKSQLSQDEDEAIDPLEISLEKATEMITNHEITDGKSIVSIFKYSNWLKEHE